MCANMIKRSKWAVPQSVFHVHVCACTCWSIVEPINVSKRGCGSKWNQIWYDNCQICIYIILINQPYPCRRLIPCWSTNMLSKFTPDFITIRNIRQWLVFRVPSFFCSLSVLSRQAWLCVLIGGLSNVQTSWICSSSVFCSSLKQNLMLNWMFHVQTLLITNNMIVSNL